MKQIIPINALGDDIAPCLPSHYYKAGARDFMPKLNPQHIPHLAILEIEMEEPKIQIAAIIDSGIGDWPTQQDDKIYSLDGISPTIAIARSNHAPKIMQIGSYVPNSKCSGKIVEPDGIAPTVMENHGMPTAVIEPAILSPIRTEEQRRLRKQGIDTFGGRQMLPRTDGVSNTITTVQKDNLLQEPIKIRQATAQGYIECPPGGGFDASYPGSKLRRGRVQDNGNVVGAITASADNHCVYEGMVAERMPRKDNISYKRMPNGNIRAFDSSTSDKRGISELQITDPSNESPTITTAHEPKVLLKYRIRKLTPTECLRLMGVDDADIEKMKSAKLTQTLKNGKVKERPMPKTQLYKMAGNSIVVDVLYHIFYQMFIAEPPKPQPKQLSLFDL